MREINVTEITAAVRQACIDANCNMPQDVLNAVEKFKKVEESPIALEVFDKIQQNAKLARDKQVAICQDTGVVVIFAEIGQDVHIVGGNFMDAINEGVRQGYKDGYLRFSVVRDPMDRVNTEDNTPAVVHTSLVEGDKIKLTVAPKGFGSENMSAMKMFTPAATREDIVSFVAECVEKAGSLPCPPIIVGVGLGGTSEMAAVLAKKACVSPLDAPAKNEFYEGLQQEMLERINALGIGPQGFGGTVTCLGVKILSYPTHIAGLPCFVNIGCNVTRHCEVIL
ncbi:MAG: fumarate hydratase [Clostridia bacterium]|nr:fumarate hydratase [Oscillospiraceae bacterium]MBQ2911818.1 fumarate hydratase [Clostridia bacterium]MBQ6868318.1 fumarate hydratase [Clostridia bacterium]MBQ6933096.1 fumarate hydratase [Clostridia bacterium]MBQ7093735.1 fumarate hydratase [Clostridia bacterium]